MKLTAKAIKCLTIFVLILLALIGIAVLSNDLSDLHVLEYSKQSPDKKYHLVIAYIEKKRPFFPPYRSYSISITEADSGKFNKEWYVYFPVSERLGLLDFFQDPQRFDSMITWSADSATCRVELPDFSIEIRGIINKKFTSNLLPNPLL